MFLLTSKDIKKISTFVIMELQDIRIGNGYDVHRLAAGLPLVLGGVEIPHTKGCVAHSDGDVIIHALCDALLGALALGDIGIHFPDTSDEYLKIDSKILLSKVMEMITSKGYRVGNVDITVICEKPKLAPHNAKMRQTLASLLNIHIDSLSIKATTSETIGFVGREEGIEAYASVLLLR